MNSPFSFNRLGSGVKWLIGINAVLFIVQQFLPGRLEEIFGLIPREVISHVALWRLFTYMFLHGSFLHILLNMFTIWMFGKELEYAWGTKEFLKFYIVCGLGAACFNTALEPFSTAPIIGASGAIYGLLVAFAILYPASIIYLYGVIPLKAKHFIILMAGFEFFASFDGVHSGIARLAHLGGMATGYLYLKSYQFRSFWMNLYHRVIDSLVIRHHHNAEEKKKNQSAARSENLAKEVDRILEKVLMQGADSLTDDEREIMRRYSAMKH